MPEEISSEATPILCGKSFQAPPEFIRMRKVDVVRGDHVVLHEISLSVATGENVAILGPNGCGKSTLIKTITRECYRVIRDNSWMKLLGHDTWDVFKLREHMGIVSNDLMLSVTGEASGRDVVLSGFFGSTAIWPNHTVDPEKIKHADAALAELKISHLADRPVEAMSSGEARRVLIARALVHKPRALLFDEPCNSLDLAAQQSVHHTMSVLANAGTAIILVTHELADIVPEIQRVVLLSQGRVVADGPKEEILQVERLKELFGVDVEMAQRDGHYHLW